MGDLFDARWSFLRLLCKGAGLRATVLSRYGVARAWSEWAVIMGTMKSVIKRLRFPLEVMLVCVRWYVAFK